MLADAENVSFPMSGCGQIRHLGKLIQADEMPSGLVRRCSADSSVPNVGFYLTLIIQSNMS